MSYLFLYGNGVYLYIANMLNEAYIYYTTKIHSLIDKITLSNYFDKKELATFAFLNIKQGKYGYCVDINNTSSMKKYKRNIVFTKLSQWKFLRFSAECEDKGGTKDGSCASGYGVCCTCK